MNREDTALLVVDAQQKLLSLVQNRERVVWNIRRLLDAARALGVPFAATDQNPSRLGPMPEELQQRVGPAPAKMDFSAAACGDIFNTWAAQCRSRVAICGIESHVCILQTALDLVAAGFQVYVVADAVSARSVVDHETALRRLESAGVILMTTEMTMFEWCRTAEAAEFKVISALAKESPPSGS